MAYSIESDLTGMKHGEKRLFSSGDSGQFSVNYEEQQAMGDNNLPARGYTTGHFHVTDPQGKTTSFRHSPQGKGLELAKNYAARQAADHITTKLFNDRRKPKGNGTQGEPGLTSL